MAELTVEMVVESVNEVLGTKRRLFDEVTPDTQLNDLKLDSLEVAELFATLEDRSGVELDPDSARSLLTVGDLARLQPVA
ncbi:MAG TPA: phosphopantetheine-binding protein [Thermoleophilaceae bacterium]|jgi:acyl carrier protein